MGSNYSMDYNVDIVMCIDATGSMQPLIDIVKKNALNLYRDIMQKMAEKGKRIGELRVKPIIFRDYIADGDDAMLSTRFFALPSETEEFRDTINGIQAKGGGDDPEDGLEALAYAMKSKWTTNGFKRRLIIVVWTDDSTHKIGFGSTAPNYPRNMPRTFDELSRWWGCGQGSQDNQGSQGSLMDKNAKRLLIFAPEKEYWTDVAYLWDNTLLFPSEAGKGLDKITYGEILDAIAGSI